MLTKDVPTFGGTFAKGTRLIITAAQKDGYGKTLYTVSKLRPVICGLPSASLSLATDEEGEAT